MDRGGFCGVDDRDGVVAGDGGTELFGGCPETHSSGEMLVLTLVSPKQGILTMGNMCRMWLLRWCSGLQQVAHIRPDSSQLIRWDSQLVRG